MAINHLGHFLLTLSLLDGLKEVPSARIINVSSSAYKFYDSFDFENMNSIDPSRYSANVTKNAGYGQSKIAQILFTRALAELGRETWAKLPRAVMPLINTMLTLILKTPHQGAQTAIYCAIAEELEVVSGRYFEDCQEKELERDYVKVEETEERLWQVSAKMVGLSET